MKTISKVTRRKYIGKVHDLKVEESETYNVEGVSVHNSSGGSVICYLMGITEVDPVIHDLLFERFISETRDSLPDIDIDFPDSTRDGVIKQLVKDYGEDQVKHIANISTLKAKSAIGNFAKNLGIPPMETEAIKNAIIERSSGDIRSKQCLQDTLITTDVGKEFVKKYPAMGLVASVEGHPDHSSVHAAGIVVCNEPIHFYAGTNVRDNTVMSNKHGSEYQNLLKIDVLGLRTLSILESCAKMVDMDHNEFYKLPLDNEDAFQIFNDGRLNGIFQFEGHSLSTLTNKMGIHIFEDIVAITSLARPGALYSGGAARYVKYRLGQEKPVYLGDLHKKITEKTYGIVVFQEQILMICREIGNMSWGDVNILRKGLSKSYGEEFFAGYKQKYMKGARENNYSESDAEFIWGEVCYGGNYAFNRCISGETRVPLVNPTHPDNRYVSIKDLYIQMNISRDFRTPVLLSLFPDGVCRPQRVIGIVRNGVKKCFKYTLENDSSFECTVDHKFIINDDWSEIGKAVVGDLVRIKAERRVTHNIRIVDIVEVGERDTYDISMPDHHNYVIEGGAITHNSHAVAYGLISYWSSYMKAHYPLEFVVASLNNEKDEESSVKILRDAIEHDGVEYDPVDPDNSELYWSVNEGKIIGGLTNIKGIGVTKARKIIKARSGEVNLTPSLYKALIDPKTPFDYLWPCKRYFGELYDNPNDYGLSASPSLIKDVSGSGKYTFIGQLKAKNVRDLNEYVNLLKRGGKVLKEHTVELAIKIEDDSDSVMAGIGRFEYEKLGREIAEEGIVDEDWFIVLGEIRGENSRYVRINNIMKIKPEEFGFKEALDDN